MNPFLLAYIDPNAGTILLQVIAAGAIGSLMFFRHLAWRLGALVCFWKPRNADVGNDD